MEHDLPPPSKPPAEHAKPAGGAGYFGASRIKILIRSSGDSASANGIRPGTAIVVALFLAIFATVLFFVALGTFLIWVSVGALLAAAFIIYAALRKTFHRF